jgi:hypothetical protein
LVDDDGPEAGEAEGELGGDPHALPGEGAFFMMASQKVRRLFDARQESDHKEFVQFPEEEARKFFGMAEAFVDGIKEYLAARG